MNDQDLNASPQPKITWRGTFIGAQVCLPVGIFAFFYGIAFGAAAAEKGMSILQTTLLSVLTFAGTTQFVLLDFWAITLQASSNFIAMMIAVFMISARFLFMGAAMYPLMRLFSPFKRYLSSQTLSEANFAYSMQEFEKGNADLGIFIGGGGIIWFTWVIGTFLGVSLGHTVADPYTYGIDTLVVTFFICLLQGQWKNSYRSGVPWLVAAVAALLAYLYLPNGYHLLVGGVAGGLTGMLMNDR